MKSYVKTCSFPCRALKQIHELGLKTDGGRYLFTIMALVSDIPIERIALLVDRPMETVAEWARRPKVEQLASEIRKHRTRRWVALVETTARVLDMAIPTLLRYLYHRYRRHDRKKQVRLQFPKRTDLAERIGMEPDEFLAMFELKQSFRDRCAERGRATPPRHDGRRSRGRPLENCRPVRDVLEQRRRRQLSWNAVADLHEELMMEPKAIRDWVIKHGQHCVPCRPLVAMDLARMEGRTQEEIANLLRRSRRTIQNDLACMERKRPFAYRLTVKDVASRFHVSRSTIVRLESRGRLTCLRRTPGGRRIFEPENLPASLPTVH